MNTLSRDRFFSSELLLLVAGIAAAMWWLSAGQADRDRVELVLGYCGAVVLIRSIYWLTGQYRTASIAHATGERQRFLSAAEADVRKYSAVGGHAFEDAVAAIFTRLGWEAERTPYSSDGGWDITLRRDARIVLVECKAYADGKVVGRPALQKLHSAMVTNRANGGMVGSTTTFSVPAETFASEHGITVIDRAGLLELHHQAYPEAPSGNALDRLSAVCHRCGRVFFFPSETQTLTVPCPDGHAVEHPLKDLLTAKALHQAKRLRRQLKQRDRDARQRAGRGVQLDQ